MKPITLTPAQMDAALGLPTLADWIAARCLEAWHQDSTTGLEYGHCCRPAGHAGDHVTDVGTRWGQDGRTRPRLECTFAGRDYDLCPACRVSG